MTLESNVQARYSTQYLANLTNPQDETPTTINSGRLTKAADDVKGDFNIYVNVDYNDANANHVNVAVDGVIVKLLIRTGQIKPGEALETAYLDRLRALAKITARDRTLPLVKTSNVDENGNPRPDPFGDTLFTDFIPSDPGGPVPLQ